MKRTLQKLVALALPLLLLAGCIQALTGAKMDVEPLAKEFDNMPVEAATIVSAVAVQTLTPPLEEFGTVTFAPNAQGISESGLVRDGFDFTGATLFAFTETTPTGTGLTAAEIEYTDAMDRKATFLFRAEYRREGNGYAVTRLDVKRSYTNYPRVQVFVVLTGDLPNGPIGSYPRLVAFLANKALTPAAYAAASKADYAVFAVGQDWAAPGSELDIAISAKKIGRSGFKKGTTSFMVDGWPVAVTAGKINPGSMIDKLYAKVTFRKGSGFGAVSRHVGTYQLAGFPK